MRRPVSVSAGGRSSSLQRPNARNVAAIHCQPHSSFASSISFSANRSLRAVIQQLVAAEKYRMTAIHPTTVRSPAPRNPLNDVIPVRAIQVSALALFRSKLKEQQHPSQALQDKTARRKS